MQTSIEDSRERRKSASPRIPVDLLVELCAAEEPSADGRAGKRTEDSWSDVSEAFGESYDADGLDLSATGLRLRSAILPDVGQRLRCRFDLPQTESICEAEGRVVWSHDAGRHGEFGLRFDALTPTVERALARWAMDRGPTTLPGSEAAPAAPSAADTAHPPRAQARSAEARTTETRETPRVSGLARVRFDGVASAIEAEISMRDEVRLDVAQALPFFELGRLASVEADGSTERRRLEHVSLCIENGVPKLILGLVAEVSSSAGGLAAPSLDAESTLEDQALDALLAERAASAPGEERVVEARSSEAKASVWVTGDEEPEPAEAATVARPEPSKRAAQERKRPLFGTSEDSLAAVDPRAQADRKKKLDEVRRVLLDGDELPEAPQSSAGTEAAGPGLALVHLRARAHAIGAAVQPSLSRLTAALRTGWAAFVAGIGPRSRAAYAAVATWIARAAGLVSDKVRARTLGAWLVRGQAKEKRRSTAAPTATAQAASPRRQRVQGAPAPVAEAVAARPRIPLRYALLGVVALGAVGSLAYAFGSGPAEAAPIVVPEAAVPTAQAPAPVAMPAAEASMPAAPPSEAPPSVAPTAAPSVLAPATPSEPSALPAPSTEEGRLPMPGYPSIGRASDTSTTSGPAMGSAAMGSAAMGSTAPSVAGVGAPAAAAGPVTSGRSFGSDRVEGGQTVTLRMSLAPSALEGQADAHGFTVTIRGALSLDRAATIARSNPAVDRASILNRGDHAVLDVRFVEGRSPPYRVEIRGEAVDISIGR
jgi:hypothetical protein